MFINIPGNGKKNTTILFLWCPENGKKYLMESIRACMLGGILKLRRAGIPKGGRAIVAYTKLRRSTKTKSRFERGTARTARQ